VTTDYFTKWVEAIPTHNATSTVVVDFIVSNIITRFGVTARIWADNVMCFRSQEMLDMCSRFDINLVHSSPYHLQSNG